MLLCIHYTDSMDIVDYTDRGFVAGFKIYHTRNPVDIRRITSGWVPNQKLGQHSVFT